MAVRHSSRSHSPWPGPFAFYPLGPSFPHFTGAETLDTHSWGSWGRAPELAFPVGRQACRVCLCPRYWDWYTQAAPWREGFVLLRLRKGFREEPVLSRAGKEKQGAEAWGLKMGRV